MHTLIVKESDGEFQSYEIEDTGGYFGEGEVVFDSRKDKLTSDHQQIINTVKAKREETRFVQLKNAESRKFLNSTDWYVIRELETGVPCPIDIKTKRAEARESIVE